ncbi:hypothetical protein [Proteus mirabilis]|uniref:hypothetical protein n=1 Tax=Proteus mirabilis TaxID=584 RepID=UPI0036BA4A99
MTEWINFKKNLVAINEAFKLGHTITLESDYSCNINQTTTLITDILTCKSSSKGIFFITINGEYYSSYYPEEQKWLKLPKSIFNKLPVSQKATHSYGINAQELFESSILLTP